METLYTTMDWEIRQEENFRYVTAGEGPVLLLLHGLFGALSNFKDLLQHFKQTHKVVIPLLPIYELPFREANLPNLVAYIESFVQHQAYESLTILGNSLGGHIALLFSLKNMAKVKALILTGSSGLFENAFGDSFPQRKNYEYIKQKTALTFYDPAMATKELVDEIFEIVNKRERAMCIISVAKSAIRHNMSEELPKITIPTLLIWGKEDKVTPPFVAEEFHQLLPNAALHFIERCGHAPMMECPKVFILLLQDFLTKLDMRKDT